MTKQLTSIPPNAEPMTIAGYNDDIAAELIERDESGDWQCMDCYTNEAMAAQNPFNENNPPRTLGDWDEYFDHMPLQDLTRLRDALATLETFPGFKGAWRKSTASSWSVNRQVSPLIVVTDKPVRLKEIRDDENRVRRQGHTQPDGHLRNLWRGHDRHSDRGRTRVHQGIPPLPHLRLRRPRESE